jgi:hypothetical protein
MRSTLEKNREDKIQITQAINHRWKKTYLLFFCSASLVFMNKKELLKNEFMHIERNSAFWNSMYIQPTYSSILLWCRLLISPMFSFHLDSFFTLISSDRPKKPRAFSNVIWIHSVYHSSEVQTLNIICHKSRCICYFFSAWCTRNPPMDI